MYKICMECIYFCTEEIYICRSVYISAEVVWIFYANAAHLYGNALLLRKTTSSTQNECDFLRNRRVPNGPPCMWHKLRDKLHYVSILKWESVTICLPIIKSRNIFAKFSTLLNDSGNPTTYFIEEIAPANKNSQSAWIVHDCKISCIV
jgi:hypothetical protein